MPTPRIACAQFCWHFSPPLRSCWHASDSTERCDIWSASGSAKWDFASLSAPCGHRSCASLFSKVCEQCCAVVLPASPWRKLQDGSCRECSLEFLDRKSTRLNS